MSDWLSAIVGGVVGLAGLLSGWMTSKQSREQAERLAAQTNEHARLLNEQTNAHARLMDEERRRHEDRLVERERRQQQINDAYVQIMTTVRLVGEKLNSDKWSPEGDSFDPGHGMSVHTAELAQSSALADTFASEEVLRLFNQWRELVATVDQAAERYWAVKKELPPGTRSETSLTWRRRLIDHRIRAGEARQALADAVAGEVGARKPKPE